MTDEVIPLASATIILLRPSDAGLEVLMGQRHSSHSFMPNRFVFPGGRVDDEDALSSGFPEAQPSARDDQEPSLDPEMRLTLARTVLRETLEETDLLIGKPANASTNAPGSAPIWQAYAEKGLRPAFEDLMLIGRAITPPPSHKRFDARFFLADGRLAHGDLPADGDSGELLDLAWRPVAQLTGLKMPTITKILLNIAVKAWKNDGPTLPDEPFEFTTI
jgi:8-oxo-dGTP pyrophosphatase MutT (NUDIX family)